MISDDTKPAAVSAKGGLGDVIFQPKVLYVVLTMVNLLNYCDRGIIPGSTNEFNEFIDKTTGTDKPDVYLGLLQSAFIVGFSMASIVCGHAVHYYPPFWLCGIGLSIWCVAVVLSGLSFWFDSYIFLILSRALSGCGEASFQCSIPPWIQSTAEEGTQASWLSLFYTAIPVGTALGYVYSSMISGSIGWAWAFILEACMMAPFVVFLFFASPRYPSLTSTANADGKVISNSAGGDKKGAEVRTPLQDTTSYDRDDIDSLNNDQMGNHEEVPSIIEELKAIFSRPVYVLIVLGYGAQTGSLIGLSTFGSSFLMGLGYYDSETDASALFGVLVSVAGIVGTLLGGYLLDRSLKKHNEKRDDSEMGLKDVSHAQQVKDQKIATIKTATMFVAIGCTVGAVCMWSIYLIYDKTLYMMMIGTGCAFLFMTTPGISIGAMTAVKEENRAFAMAMMSVCLHLFGDVPSPVIAGYLKDDLAPNCVGVPAASEECRQDNHGIRVTMLLITIWLIWCTVLFGGARLICGFDYLRNDADDEVEDDTSFEGVGISNNSGTAKVPLLNQRKQGPGTAI